MPSRLPRLILFIAVLLPCPQARADTFEKDVAPLLEEFCVRCHGPRRQKGKLRLDTLTPDFTDHARAATWIEVRDRIHLGEMPPPDEDRPSLERLQAVTSWIARGLREAERARHGAGGRVLLRRLNRHEYTNTVADLLHLRFPLGESPLDSLPPDGTAEGFEKVSAALLLDPSLLTLYYRVARRLADRAIVDGPPEYPTATMRLEFEEIPDSNAIGYLVTRRGMRPVPGGLELVEGDTRSWGMLRYPGRKDNNVAPVSGFYRFTLRAGGWPGENGEVPRIILTHDHPDDSQQVILETDVHASPEEPAEYSVVVPRDTLGGELHVRLVNETRLSMSQRPGEHFMRRNGELGKAGKFAETIRLTGRKIAEGWGGDRSTPDPEKLDLTRYPRVFLDSLVVEGPLYEQWPPKSHEEVLFRGEGADETPEYAREIFTRFLPRAWRRPVTDEEVGSIVKVVERELAAGESFHEAIRVGLTAALTSPSFLYLFEPSTSEEPRPLTDHELASRLSYFLWSSLPDAELRELADSGKLRERETLLAQVDRLLGDEKIGRFIEDFGRQWLRTETFLAFEPDRHVYRSYDEKLAEAFVREPIAFLREVLAKNLPLTSFLDSDFVVVNERLARHYEIPGVEGEEFRRVPVPDGSPRGGLLTMGGVHQAGSDGVRTKPVHRAVWIREVLFHDPPDPPPPNVGEIEPNIRGENLTVRERLLKHQEIENCAACHRSLDPYGLALENFNVIGTWRERQDGERFDDEDSPRIDASGRLPNGQEFSDFESFRARLLDQAPRFRRALAEKLLIYALGRPVGPDDDSTLEQITRSLKENGDTLRGLLRSLVLQEAFQRK